MNYTFLDLVKSQPTWLQGERSILRMSWPKNCYLALQVDRLPISDDKTLEKVSFLKIHIFYEAVVGHLKRSDPIDLSLNEIFVRI